MRCGPFHRLSIVIWGAAVVSTVSLSCGRDTVTRVVDQGTTSEVTIDPNGDTDFFLASKIIAGEPDSRVDVWGENLEIINGTRVIFDVVLVNESETSVYPLLFLYVTKTVPSTVSVVGYDSRGFESSFVFDLSHCLGGDDRLEPGERSTPKAVAFDVPEVAPFGIEFRIVAGAPPVEVDCPEPYPTEIAALPFEILESLRAEFMALNPDVCSDLNQYGFTEGFCSPVPKSLPDDVDIEQLIAEAKATLAANCKFTGICDESSLAVSSYTLFKGVLRLYFAPQVYEGLEVVHTSVGVKVDADGMRSIDGNHYPEICVPPRPILPPIQAQESIIGLGIRWYDFGGHPQVHTVSEEDLSDPPTKVVLPHERNGAIQLRVAWRIPVEMSGMQAWYVYVDTMDRALLWVEQLFQT